MLCLREFGVVVLGTVVLELELKSLPITGWYVVYSVILQNRVIADYFRVQIMLVCLSKLCLKNWCD